MLDTALVEEKVSKFRVRRITIFVGYHLWLLINDLYTAINIFSNVF